MSIVQTKAKQWLADISFFKSAKEDFTTTLACQLDTGATCNVIGLDDLSAITHLGDPPMNNSSVKLKLFGGTTLKPVGEYDFHVRVFQVIKHKCKPLLSADTCEMLQLILLNVSVPENVRQVSETLPQKCLSKEELQEQIAQWWRRLLFLRLSVNLVHFFLILLLTAELTSQRKDMQSRDLLNGVCGI